MSESTSASPSASASLAPEIAAAAQVHTPEGAVEFAKLVTTEIGRAWASNDPANLMAMSLDRCRGCAVLGRGVNEQATEGVRPAEQRVVIEGAQIFAQYEEAQAEVDVLGIEKATNLIDTDGKVVDQLPEEVLRLRIGLIWGASGWRVGEIMAVNV